MTFRIEYEFPFMRAIYREDVEANDEKEAEEKFEERFPRARIRKMNTIEA